MPRITEIHWRKLVKLFELDGWKFHHQTGSHVQFRHVQNITLRVTIPSKRKDVAPKTLKTIIRQAGLTVDQFIDLL